MLKTKQNDVVKYTFVTKRILFFLLFLLISSISYSQSSNQLPLQDALIEISKQNKLSLIFNPQNLSNNKVDLPSTDWSIDKQLKAVLRGTNLSFEIRDEQIYLYKNHNIYGYIEDVETGERLISATIYLPNSGEYDVANESGYFTLSTKEDSVVVEASYIGYATLTKTIGWQDMDRPISLGLSLDNNVKQVTISDALVTNQERKYIELNKGSDILLYQNQSSSAVGGEPDIFQAMIRQSGVNSGPDGLGGIHIRGGKNDQNQVLYDGVRLYNSAHAFGMYSIINSNVIDQARMHKSGASGAISGRLSSILDVKIREPNLNRFKTNAQISTVASQFSFETPILKDKLGILVNARRSHVDPVIKSLSRNNKEANEEDGETNFYFDDVSLKMYGKISNNQRVYFSYYRATDNYLDNIEQQIFGDLYDPTYLLQEYYENSSIRWSNKLAALRYNIILSANTFANVQVSRYSYSFRNEYLSEFAGFIDIEPFYDRLYVDFESGIKTYDLRLDFQTHTVDHEIKYGAFGGIKKYRGGLLTEEDLPDTIDNTQPFDEEILLVEQNLGDYHAQEATVYVSDKYKWNEFFLLESGIYATYFKSTDQNLGDIEKAFFNMHGYFKAVSMLSDNINIGAKVGTYVQNEHLLTVGDNGYPSDIWLPSIENRPPERAYQAEVYSELAKGEHKLKASAYYKEQKNLIVLDFEPVLPSITNVESDIWEEETFLADAKSLGLELDYSYSIKDKISLRSIYTASFTDYYDSEEGDKLYPFEYSIPHTINFGVNAQLMKRLQLSLDWYFASGRPHTLYSVDKQYSPIERPESGAIVEQESDFYNDARLPATHKLSAAFTSYWYWGKAKCNLTLGIQNIYNKRNLLYTYFFDDYESLELRDQSAFPMIPIFKWRVDFE